MAMMSDSIERRSVADLIPYEKNPKLHPDSQIEQLANSIREWGFTIPVLIDPEGNVIAGHGRLFAAERMGIEEVPCVVARGWTEQQRRAYVIADNKLAENSEWDAGQYFSELKAISDSGFDMELIGIDTDFSLDFEPNLNPLASFSDVSNDDIKTAESSMSSHMGDLKKDRSSKATEVMCPYCAESFTFDGI